MFFKLPESAGFLLAGGAAMVAQGLSMRPTQDLDFFTAPASGDVVAAAAGIRRKAARLGWTVSFVQQHETFQRLVLGDYAADEQMLVDLAVDSRPGRPPTASVLGPTFSPEELAGRKTVALFDRAEARDFVDVYALASRYERSDLLAWAAEVDAGFSHAVFADMLHTLIRYADRDLPIAPEEVQNLRDYFSHWGSELSAG